MGKGCDLIVVVPVVIFGRMEKVGNQMKFTFARAAVAVLMVGTIAGCGGGGGDAPAPPQQPPPPSATLAEKIAAAAAVAANDTSTNSTSAFKVLQDNGVAAVTVASPPKVNFTVFSDGAVKKDLTVSNVRFAIAKLVPGTNGDIDQWVSYINRTETATANVGPGGKPVLASAKQATTENPGAAQASQLVFNNDGYYTYTFSLDITDPAKTMGVTFEPNRTHRIAIQLSYVNRAGETVRVNPYFDFTVDASGKSVAVTDPAKTRVMADIASCNGCHEKLALHGGGRVDTQYCVMCHNPGTTDANSGNVLTMQTMVHKLHAGRLLHTQKAAGGEDYVIWGFRDSKHDYSEVGFPQDLRNCSVCHDGSNPKTPQGDNWKTRPSKESCLTCHANNAGSSWNTSHTLFYNGADPKAQPNSTCVACHTTGALSPARVHFNQVEANSAKYKMNIESATFDSAARKVTVKYFLSDPTNNNAAYNLVTPDCTGAGATLSCSNQTRFGNLRLYLAYQNLVGQSTAVTEFSAFNNGGSAANVFAYKGTNDGSNKYTIDIPLPADSAIAVAAGTARVLSIGQIKEPKLVAKSAADPRPEALPPELVNVLAQNTFKDVVLSGTLTPRRVVVSNEKCNVCHGALGATSGSNTLANAFHGGARNTIEACQLCHDSTRSSSTVMTNGLNLRESYHFKRMIHGIHGNSKRNHPFTHGNNIIGPFSKDGFLTAAGLTLTGETVPAGTPLPPGTENYAAEVAYPDLGLSCNACHVNDSYKLDRGPLGSNVTLRVTGTDPRTYNVISPQAATCTACHDSPQAIGHVTTFGNASFGNRTQAQSLLTRETCTDCHASGGFKGVDIVHGLR